MDAFEKKTTDAQAVIDVAQLAVRSRDLDPETCDLFSVTVPAGAAQKLVDLERYLPAPRRTSGTYTLHTVDELVRFVKAQESAGHRTSVWIDLQKYSVTVVFNDGDPKVPAWRDHRAVLTLRQTPEWQHWLNPQRNGALLDQATFAEHIEDGLEEIVTPDAATMLEIAQSFHATTGADFSSGERLQSGEVKFAYKEETTARAGKQGDIEVPLTIALKISPFVGEDPYEVEARFRYRTGSNGLRLGYKVVRPERVLDHALTEIHTRLLGEFEPDAPADTAIYLGNPADAVTAR